MFVTNMSFILYALTTISTLILTVYLVLQWAFKYWERRKIFYITPSFPVGSMDTSKSIPILFANLHNQIKNANQRYGGVYIFTIPMFIPTDPEIIKDMLTVNFLKFNTRGIYCDEKVDPITGHLLSLPYDRWKPLRTKMTPAFSSGKLKSIINIMKDCTKPLEDVLDKSAEKKTLFDAQNNFKRLTMNIIGSTVFGIEINSFEEEDDLFIKYTDCVLRPTGLYALRVNFCFLLPKIATRLRIPMAHPFFKNFIFKVISDNMKYRIENNVSRKDFFNILMDLHRQENGLTLMQTTAQAGLFLVAGFDTSSSTMTYCVYELARSTDLQDKVREEILKVLKKYNGEVTYDGLQEMTYLQQTIDETLRKYPPLAQLNRECSEDYVIPGTDTVIEKGTSSTISVLGLHMDPENFPNPEKFDPDRFSPENKHNIKPFTYLPFGDGPRNCIGMRFGYIQTKIGLVSALKNHSYSVSPTTVIKMNPKSFLLSNEGPVDLFVSKIK